MTDPIVSDEKRHDARQTRIDTAREYAHASLREEYLDAAKQPKITTVATPGNTRTRVPFTERFLDELNHDVAARIVEVLKRDADGMALLEELATAHADYFADEVNQ